MTECECLICTHGCEDCDGPVTVVLPPDHEPIVIVGHRTTCPAWRAMCAS